MELIQLTKTCFKSSILIPSILKSLKIDDSFLVGKFVIDGFSTHYWLDILFNLLATDKKNHIGSFYVELILPNEKWLISCSYNTNKTMICNHLDVLSTNLDVHSTSQEKLFILGDFNVGIDTECTRKPSAISNILQA